MLLRVVGHGRDLFHDKPEMFDGLVVVTVFICYMVLTAADTDELVAYSLAYIIVFRLWRIQRIYRSKCS